MANLRVGSAPPFSFCPSPQFSGVFGGDFSCFQLGTLSSPCVCLVRIGAEEEGEGLESSFRTRDTFVAPRQAQIF